MKNDYIQGFCKTYKINGKTYTLSATYCPPYNLKKDYIITENKDIEFGIPYAKEIFRSNDLEKCLIEINNLKKTRN